MGTQTDEHHEQDTIDVIWEIEAKMSENTEIGDGIPEMSAKQARDYFHRSYTSVDGLWFMKVEERWGFEEALVVDQEVWKILPKIQARTVRSLLGLGDGMSSLRACLGSRLRLEGFDFQMGLVDAKDGETVFDLLISMCPWQELLHKSGRGCLGPQIGPLICGTEMSVWATEFGDIECQALSRICGGDRYCRHRFATRAGQPPAP
ncbi:MAG: hypothetical protein A4E45_00299 [Methanosaeta sp. PtaB.Bin039]|nr:MAG: hypothetical protein A4E45_00299 [Methanosaeta sp. PtaB.Bin039]OPY44759.1 MAG: hypothetical protein A4E47_01341 [Methanosaeta sp. PtaU1.Bin028]